LGFGRSGATASAQIAMMDATGLSVHSRSSTISATDWDEMASIRANGDGSTLTLLDKQGFAAVLGNTGLEITQTGETRKTSAASLVMHGKDGKVLWRAP
jgi:hypothetical protein